MNKLILIIFICLSSLLNAQFLGLMQKLDKPELNSNTSLDFSYTEIFINGDFSSSTISHLTGIGSVSLSHNNTDKVLQITLGSTSTCGFYDAGLLTNNKLYWVNFEAKSTAYTGTANQILVSGSVGTTIHDPNMTSSYQDYEFIVLNGTNDIARFYFDAGTTGQIIVIDNISVKEVIAPTSWTSPTMTATDYVIEDSGCKLVEVTGETYIQMSDTLDTGYYKLKVTQDWTQGKLWAYNGTTTYNFPQADGEYTVKIYLPGNKPLVIGCDNNTISTISSLSIK